MKLFLLKNKGSIDNDYAAGFVVRAENEGAARGMASGRAGDEGPGAWTDAGRSTCDVIAEDSPGIAGILLADFRAG